MASDTEHPAREVILALREELLACEDVATRAQLERDTYARQLMGLRRRLERLEQAAWEIAAHAPTSDVFFGKHVWLPFAYVEGLRAALAGDGSQPEGT